MAVVIHTRMKASSLVEALTAMVIITIAFSACFVIFSNVDSSGRTTLRMRARQSVIQYAAEVKASHQFTNQNTTGDGFQIQSHFQPFHDASDVVYMHIVARSSDNHMLYQHHELIYDAE